MTRQATSNPSAWKRLLVWTTTIGAVRNSPSINDDPLMDLFRFLADPPNADED